MIGIQPAMVNFRLSSARRFHSKLTQECHHRAPISKRRLEEVQAYEGGEQIPVGRDPVAECELDQDKNASDQAHRAFDVHTRTSEASRADSNVGGAGNLRFSTM